MALRTFLFLFFTLTSAAGIFSQKPYIVTCPSQGADVQELSGLYPYNNKFSLNPKSTYLFLASKKGYRTDCLLLTPELLKTNKLRTFQFPDLKIFPSPSTVGKYVHGNEMKWADPKMKYKRVYYRDLNDPNSKIEEDLDGDVSTLENIYGDLSASLQRELYFMGLYDTTATAIQDNSKRCLLDVTIHDVAYEYAHYKVSYYSNGLDLMKVKATFNFELKDMYSEIIFSKMMDTESVIYIEHDKVNLLQNALQRGLVSFLELNELKDAIIMREERANNTASLTEIAIGAPSRVSTSIPQFLQSTVTLFNENSHGSGCLISNDGYIITNNHVVMGDSVYKVILNKGDTLDAKVIRKDWKYDLALLKASISGEYAFKINQSASVELADKVYVVGTPADVSLGQTISGGIISAHRNFFGRDYYQTDARLNGGNSGGALVNEKGELIGVVCSKIIGLGIEGVGFVIPAKYIFERLKVVIQ